MDRPAQPIGRLLVATALLSLFLLVACGPWAEVFGSQVHLAERLQSPSWSHPLGTDNLGRDLLVRIGAALRLAVVPLWLGVVLASASGVALGAVALSLRQVGWLRCPLRTLSVVAALLVSIPVTLTAFGWAVMSTEVGLKTVLLALVLVFCLRNYLLVLDLARRDEHLTFWNAHAALGGRCLQRVWSYGLAGAWRQPLATALAFHLRAAVAIEASLSYLGFGIQEPQASFGNMLAAHFDLYLKGDWTVLAIIIIALLLTGLLPAAVMAAVPPAKARLWRRASQRSGLRLLGETQVS